MLLELGHDRGELVSSPRGPFRCNLNYLPLRAPVGILSPGGLGMLSEFPYWNAVFDLYRHDDVVEANKLAEQIGVGAYGDYLIPGDLIALEAATSEESEIVRVDDRLEVEYIPSQLDFSFDDFGHTLAAAHEGVLALFESAAPAVDTLLTLLYKDGEIPTTTWHDGYFTPKTECGKICLPMPQSAESIVKGLRRGLTYQLTYEITAGQAELWFLEAATVLTDPGSPIPTPARRDESELNHALVQLEETDGARANLSEARGICQAMGRFLLDRGGADGLVKCMAAHADAFGRFGIGKITDRALRSTYDLSFEDVFDGILGRRG